PGSCPWPGPWARTYGAHLPCRHPGSTSPSAVADRSLPAGPFPVSRLPISVMDAAAKELKKTLRGAALARRDALDPAWRADASLAMAAAADTLAIAPGTVVSGFLPIRSEADLKPLMAALAQRGARLCLPVILDRATIVFREYLA